MPRDPECTFAILQLGEQQTKTSTNWFKRVTGSVPAMKSPTDYKGRLSSAAAVVIQSMLLDACKKAGIKTTDAQFDELPKGFHVVVMFGLCLVMSIYFLLNEEGQTVDAKKLGQGMVGALLIMRSYEDKQEQYNLANTLLKRFIAVGPKANEWQNNLNQLVSMYLLSSQNEKLKQ